MTGQEIALAGLAWLAAGMAGWIGAGIDCGRRGWWGLCFAAAIALLINGLTLCAWPTP